MLPWRMRARKPRVPGESVQPVGKPCSRSASRRSGVEISPVAGNQIAGGEGLPTPEPARRGGIASTVLARVLQEAGEPARAPSLTESALASLLELGQEDAAVPVRALARRAGMSAPSSTARQGAYTDSRPCLAFQLDGIGLPEPTV